MIMGRRGRRWRRCRGRSTSPPFAAGAAASQGVSPSTAGSPGTYHHRRQFDKYARAFSAAVKFLCSKRASLELEMRYLLKTSRKNTCHPSVPSVHSVGSRLRTRCWLRARGLSGPLTRRHIGSLDPSAPIVASVSGGRHLALLAGRKYNVIPQPCHAATHAYDLPASFSRQLLVSREVHPGHHQTFQAGLKSRKFSLNFANTVQFV